MDVATLQAAKNDAKRKYLTTLRPSGGDDTAAINAALTSSSMVILTAPSNSYFKLIAGPIVMPSNTTLVIHDAEVRRIFDGAAATATNSQIIVNANARTLTSASSTATLPDQRINIFGIGRAKLTGQTSAYLLATATAGATTLSLSSPLPAGTYYWGDDITGASETITVSNGNSTSATTAPYTATLSTPLVAGRTFNSSSRLGISDMRRHTSGTAGQLWHNIGIAMVNASGVRIRNVRLGATQAFAMNFQVCTDVQVDDVTLDQDGSTINQDGIDLGPGCSDIHVTNINGTTGDDFASLYAQNTSGSLHPWVNQLTQAQRNSTNITYTNIKVRYGVTSGNMFRMQAGDQSTLTRVKLSNLTAIGLTGLAVIQFGERSYVTSAPNAADLSDISLDGFTGACTNFLSFDTSASHVVARNVLLTTKFFKLLGQNASGAYSPTVNDVRIENASSAVTTAGSYGSVALLQSGTWSNVKIALAKLKYAKYVLANTGATVTNISLTDIDLDTSNEAPFQLLGTETGTARNVTVTAGNVAARYTGGAAKLLLASTPTFTSADTVPFATEGSVITCDATLDPTGNGAVTGGRYLAVGGAWARFITSLDASGPWGFPYSFDPGQPRGTDVLALSGTQTVFYRTREGGVISKIGVEIGTSSGNISVAVYRNSGLGRSSTPGTRLATSGSIACPAPGYTEVSLGATVTLYPGDWLALSADNSTATFRSLVSATAASNLALGRTLVQGIHPAPASPSGLAARIGSNIILVGAP